VISGILSPGDKIYLNNGVECRVEQLLGAGGQGEVYRVRIQGASFALKWYYRETATPDQWDMLRTLIDSGPPDSRFLWPTALVIEDSKTGWGYLMALREPQYKGIADLLLRNVTPTFRGLSTACINLADAFLQLHAKGLCYRDISMGNVFFHPSSGSVRVCDNDNVGVNGGPTQILGTPRFMAPEVVRGETLPSTQTDLYSLAVLLFLMLVFHHPLDGRREQAIHCLNRAAMEHLYGTDPVFIFDPNNHSNEPDPDYQQNALVFWPLYPAFLQRLFIQSFTEGLKDPVNGRVRESTWRTEMSRLRDSIYYCTCSAENFYDAEALRGAGGNPRYCWNCGRQLQLPPRIRIGKTVVMLNHDSKLYAHHLDDAKAIQFDTPVGEVTRHPTDATRWGLKNLGDESWSATLSDGTVRQIDPAKNLTIAPGTRIHFGAAEGDFRI
jgi:DNA-binding helix-hairpin-helix protein with protein kinase domain